MSLGSLSVSLTANISEFKKKLDEALKSTKRFNESLNKQTASAGSNIAKTTAQLNNLASGLNTNYGRSLTMLKAHNLGLKDTARIVQGIMISQVFYQIAGSIRDATSALMEFNETLDYAQVTYSALFGDTQLATDYLDVLQAHSVNTIFDFEALTRASKQLTAYGIEYKNLMFIMQGLTNLGAMSGDTASLERISYAIGQIKAKGTLKAEEMRQLANAYVPIQEIVQKRFNLTEDQMGSIGDLQLPAEAVINAIVDYANEQFGQVGEAAMYTFTGLKNRIVDTLKVTGVEVIQPVSEAYKSFLAYVANSLDRLRASYQEGGLGGLLNQIVPDPAKQTIIRQFLANVLNALTVLKTALMTAAKLAGHFMHVMVAAFNIVGPTITMVANVLIKLVDAMATNSLGAIILRGALVAAATGFVLLRLQALRALVVQSLALVITNLSKALLVLSTVLTSSKLTVALVAIVALLTAIAAASDKAQAALSRFFSFIAGGVKSTDVLKETDKAIEDATDKAEKFSERYDESAAVADALADSLNGTTKAAKKNALAFDEIFRLTDGQQSVGIDLDGLSDDIAEINVKLGELDFGLDIPDFSDYATRFAEGLKSTLLGKLATAAIGYYIARKLGESLTANGVLTPAFAKVFTAALKGAAIGLAYDALASLITDKLWEALEKAIKLKDGSAENAKLGSTLGAVIGGAIGMAVGGLKGSLIGAAIGQLAGGIVGLAWEEIGNNFNNTVVGGLSGIWGSLLKGLDLKAGGVIMTALAAGIQEKSFSAFFSAVGGAFKTAGLKSILKGGVIGLAIGLVTDSIAALLWKSLAEATGKDEGDIGAAKVGQTIGSVLGTIIGGLLGGPVGAIIGSAIGTFVGGLAGLFNDEIAKWAGGIWQGFVDGLFAGGGFMSLTLDILSSAAQFFEDAKKAFVDKDWGELGKNILLGIGAGLLGAIVAIPEFVARVFMAILGAFLAIFGIHSPAKEMEPVGKNILLGVLEGMIGFIGGIPDYIASVGLALVNAVGGWFVDVGLKVAEWVLNTGEKLTNWARDTSQKISEWWTNVKSKFDAFKETSFAKWCTSTFEAIANWCSDVYNAVKDKITKAIDKVKEFLGLSSKEVTITAETSGYNYRGVDNRLSGHAKGGIFNREHIARFAEGNKAEAVIPLQDSTAMQPFVNAIADGITSSLAPILVGTQSEQQLQPLYVGTLIADERSLKELERKMQVIRIQEGRR